MKGVLKRQAQTGLLGESRPSLPTDRPDPEVPIMHMCTQERTQHWQLVSEKLCFTVTTQPARLKTREEYHFGVWGELMVPHFHGPQNILLEK